MAYFECVIGSAASGGSGADLIVSCTSGFAGSVITCTNGTDTFTQTCPSTSPYEVTFESIPTGTWTISGVSDGQTFTQSVTITDFTASLNDIPEGSTVTPVNDIQIWLHCANIWDKSYTTISQVLSDTSTLLTLISSNNAVDYMVRSTSWASSVCANQTAMGYIGNNNYCANNLLANSTWKTAICNSTYFESVLNVKVPTMTSNTTPSGQAFATSTHSDTNLGCQAYNVFDGNVNKAWHASTAEGFPQGVGYKFTTKRTVYKIVFAPLCYMSISRVKTYKIQGSNDGNTWTDLTETLTAPNTSSGVAMTQANCTVGTSNTVIVSKNIAAYQYYRLYDLSSYETYKAAVCNLQFYGR